MWLVTTMSIMGLLVLLFVAGTRGREIWKTLVNDSVNAYFYGRMFIELSIIAILLGLGAGAIVILLS